MSQTKNDLYYTLLYIKLTPSSLFPVSFKLETINGQMPKYLPPPLVFLASNQEAPYWLWKDTTHSQVIKQLWLLLFTDKPEKAPELVTIRSICNEGKICSKLIYNKKTQCNEDQMMKHTGKFHKSNNTIISS